jgi:hypothetical protein
VTRASVCVSRKATSNVVPVRERMLILPNLPCAAPAPPKQPELLPPRRLLTYPVTAVTTRSKGDPALVPIPRKRSSCGPLSGPAPPRLLCGGVTHDAWKSNRDVRSEQSAVPGGVVGGGRGGGIGGGGIGGASGEPHEILDQTG